jgi:hypothetical protein
MCSASEIIYDAATCETAAVEQGYDTSGLTYTFNSSTWAEIGCGKCSPGLNCSTVYDGLAWFGSSSTDSASIDAFDWN